MNSFINTWADFWSRLMIVLRDIRIRDIVDVSIVAYLIYHAIRLVRETRAMQLLKGIAAILVLYFIAAALKMVTIGFFFQNIWQVGMFAIVALFQPELRSALEKMGRQGIGTFRRGVLQSAEPIDVIRGEELIEILVDACRYLSKDKTGALIVLEGKTRLGDVIDTGTVIDSKASVELISNIFFKNSPLHDGAMIIRNHKIYAAGCYLPLSQNMEISRELGTRHRAALGMSEESDALIIVVSEETGHISVAQGSRLKRDVSGKELGVLLHRKLLGNDEQEQPADKKRVFWRRKNEK